MLEVRLLGMFDVKDEGRDILIHGRPEQSLFAYLILNSGKHHRREKLAALLWADSQDTPARDNLRHVLWRIRKTLPTGPDAGYLLTNDLSVAFNGSTAYWLDVDILKSAGTSRTADELLQVLRVYQGELLPGFSEEWVTLERGYLNYVFEHHMARLLNLLKDECRWLDILEWGEHWLTFGQRPEPAYRALMRAHMEMGENASMAETYARCEHSLAEIGLGPSDQTRELYKRLKSGKLSQSTIQPCKNHDG